MARIICIDFGLKRCGLAVTDPLQIIATGLEVIHPKELIAYLKKYLAENEVERILIGLPLNLDDSATHATAAAHKAFEQIKRTFPQVAVEQIDERYSSRRASQAMHQMGMKKSKRQIKGNVDIIAATMMLQEYMENG